MINKDKEFKLKARIIQTEIGYYHGQIYIEEFKEDKQALYSLKTDLEPGWHTVTSNCYTRFGCKIELRKWKKLHTVEELYI